MNIPIEQASEIELTSAIPELLTLNKYVENNAWHDHDNVYVHSMAVFNNIKKNILFSFIADSVKKEILEKYLNTTVGSLTKKQILLWCGLLHDIAKPKTFQKVGTETKCPQHEAEGAVMIEGILKRLQIPERDRQLAYTIVFNHAIPHYLLSPKKDAQQLNADIQRFKTDHADHVIELLLLGLSDTEGCQLKYLGPEEFQFRVTKYYSLL